MGFDDLKNKAQEATGKAKEAAGDATNNESLKTEGKADQGSAAIKDKANDVKEKAAGAVNDALDK